MASVGLDCVGKQVLNGVVQRGSDKPAVHGCFSKRTDKLSLGWSQNSAHGVRLHMVQKEKSVSTKHSLGPRAAKRISSGRSLALSSTLVVEEGKGDEAREICAKITEWAKAKQADKKNGIEHFEVSSDAYDANVIHFWERYETFKSMNDIHASPDYSEFLDKVRPLLTGPVQLAAYEYKDGQIGCMLNPIGPKGEGGLDDATGQGGSGGGASYKQTSQSLKQGITEDRDWGLQKALDISNARSKKAAELLAEGLKNIFGSKN